MSYENGRLPDSALAAIQGGRLRKDAARAWNAMCDEAERRGLTVPHPTSRRVAYRTLAEQQEFWRLYQAGRGALAAQPGTSNHGWGIAVDVASPAMRSTIDQIGAPFGWSKEWSDAPSEWWHIRFDPSRVAADLPGRDIDVLGPTARRWAAEYLSLKAADRDLGRRRVLRRVLIVRRKAEWVAAKRGPQAQRAAAGRRYDVLRRVTG